MNTIVKYNPYATQESMQDEMTKELFTKDVEVSSNDQYKMKFEAYGRHSVFVNIFPNKKETTVDDVLSHSDNFDMLCRKVLLAEKLLSRIHSGSDGDQDTWLKMKAFLKGDVYNLEDEDISRLIWMAAKPY